MSMAVTQSQKAADMNRAWHLIDATDLVLGRLASRSARILMGKHRPTYTPHADTGDFVVVINAGKVKVTGNKAETKKYYHHSGYPGGLKERAYTDLIESRPEEIIRLAVKRMLPKTKLGRQMIRKLKVYAGTEHPHEAQMPTPLDITKEL